jgi:hypothetical protein
VESISIIDTFPAFNDFWLKYQGSSIEEQIEGWKSLYLASWPDLLSKQIGTYEDENTDWKQIAREKIFPILNSRLPAMITAHDQLIKYCEPVYLVARNRFSISFPMAIVIYVGLGLGAGWATTLSGQPSILFGLENIAEEGWTQTLAIEGLIAHEMGHLIQHHLRENLKRSFGAGPWWQLYTEGFAQHCEHLILGKESWHMTLGAGYQDWLLWCQKNLKWLASEYLRRVDSHTEITPFFGSWHELNGKKQTGYFLGRELILRMESRYSIEEIACIADVDNEIKKVVNELAD